MNINLEVIVNVCLGMILYNFVISAMFKALFIYFLDNNKTVQKEKELILGKLKEKLNQSDKGDSK